MRIQWRTVGRWGLIALVVAGLVAVLGPYVIPLPAQPDRDAAELAPSDGRFIVVDGYRTFIQEAGPVDGPPVVLVHGFGGLTYSWRYTLPRLAAAGFRVLALDLRGFGLSDKDFEQDYSHPAQADFVMQVMTAVDMPAAVLVGHSMGGNIIAHAAQRHPERVRALVFVDGAVREPGGAGGGSVLGLPVQIGELANFPPFRRWGQLFLRGALTRERLAEMQLSAYVVKTVVTPEVEQAYLQILDLAGWDLALLGVLRDSGRGALAQPVSTITAPVLIVWGEQDPWIPLARGEALRASLPQAAWQVIPAVGHLPMEEAPEAFNTTLIAYLKGLAFTAPGPAQGDLALAGPRWVPVSR